MFVCTVIVRTRHNTLQGGRITLKRAATVKRRFMQTIKRDKRTSKPHHRVQQTAEGVVIELEEKRKAGQYPDEALHRLQVLFPSSPVVVVKRIIKSAPHEECAVFRLLHLGYPMRLIKDYQLLKYAGKQAYKRKRNTAVAMRKLSVRRNSKPKQLQPRRRAANENSRAIPRNPSNDNKIKPANRNRPPCTGRSDGRREERFDDGRKSGNRGNNANAPKKAPPGKPVGRKRTLPKKPTRQRSVDFALDVVSEVPSRKSRSPHRGAKKVQI